MFVVIHLGRQYSDCLITIFSSVKVLKHNFSGGVKVRSYDLSSE